MFSSVLYCRSIDVAIGDNVDAGDLTATRGCDSFGQEDWTAVTGVYSGDRSVCMSCHHPSSIAWL